MEWQPIDTAPRDGETHILVYVVNRMDGDVSKAMVRTARWSKTKRKWLVAWDNQYATCRSVPPAGWMPLPAPPND